jgi:hypothetical protein
MAAEYMLTEVFFLLQEARQIKTIAASLTATLRGLRKQAYRLIKECTVTISQSRSV